LSAPHAPDRQAEIRSALIDLKFQAGNRYENFTLETFPADDIRGLAALKIARQFAAGDTDTTGLEAGR
jgi:hypothetical protein